jgi:hypothetical protein
MLKHFNFEEMVAVTAPLVKNTRRRKVFLSIPEIAPLHSKVIKAHQAALAVRPADSTPPPALQALIDKGTEEDKRHDALARAVSSGLQADAAHCVAQEPPDAARALQCQQMETKLFPMGMAIVNVSLLAESGNAARIAQLLKEEPAIGEFLKTIPVRGGKTLFDMLQGWLASGARLGKIEHDREEILAQLATSPVTKVTIQEARSQWLRTISLVLTNLDASDAPAEAIESIRGPILRASERAGQRYATGKTGEPVVEPDEGSTGDDGEGEEK